MVRLLSPDTLSLLLDRHEVSENATLGRTFPWRWIVRSRALPLLLHVGGRWRCLKSVGSITTTNGSGRREQRSFNRLVWHVRDVFESHRYHGKAVLPRARRRKLTLVQA